VLQLDEELEALRMITDRREVAEKGPTIPAATQAREN
jgi:hypothetical protein